MSDLLFVYGTLKRGYWNNPILNTSKFLGEAVTEDKFLLLDGPFPVLVREQVNIFPVRGEVWEVSDEATWKLLDRLEGVPRMYTRETIPVGFGKSKTTKAQVYIGTAAWFEHRPDKHCPVIRNAYEWNRRPEHDDD